MTKLSAVIITLNEERNIGRCLESLQNVADEIIVVDSGSTDQTEAICSRFQVKFIKQDWLGYGAQKNLGATHTTNNYIFSIDADEALSETLKESILYEKKQGFLAAGYAMNILTNYCGHWVKHSGWYPGRKNRIYDKTQVKWNDSGIHEHLVFTPNQTINFLDGDLLHYSYHTRDDQQRKLDSYTQLFIEKRIKQGKSPSIIRAIFSACACFLSMYIFQLGFLDGRIGFTIARFSAIGKYRKYRMRQVPIKHKKIEQLNPFPLPDSTNIHTHVFQSGEQRRFSIIIPTWNNLPMLRLCVESLRKNSRFKHQIILHINEGKDGTREWAEANNIDYSHTASNVGVCLAVNSAATLANTDYIVYMNDDMYACPDWDFHLWKTIEEQPDNLFFLSATSIEPRNAKKHVAIAPFNFGTSLENFREKDLLEHYAELPISSDWSGASWPPNIVHREIWEKVGGYSLEFFPGFYSDPDFSMKLWKAGVRRFKGVSESRVYHFLEVSTKKMNNSVNQANYQFLKKWGITSRTFYTFYLRMGEPWKGPLTIRKDVNFIIKKGLCTIKRMFV